jgi:hypothetical protein
VPSGNTSANFIVSTVACASGPVTLSATLGGATLSAGLTVVSGADVAIQQADYFAGTRELRVVATTSAPGATLTVHVTSSGALIGTLHSVGDDRYSGQFKWSVKPESITVRSSVCGSATRVVRRR